MLISLNPRLSLLGLSLLSSFSALACNDTRFSDFDFWVGEWEVRYANGEVAGTNTISPSLNGCALEEHYVAANGYEGKSLNTFDQSTQQWHQTWVDNTGLVLQLDGNLSENKMALWGKGLDQSGKLIMHRIVWEKLAVAPQGQRPSLTQTWQVSQDQGLSWQTLFEGLYFKAHAAENQDDKTPQQPVFNGR
ncbi:hypothetical protein [Alteromonas sp. a30]|uniref:hypothetical protein n=1 Tax=Alteromonas sp. a30 TaxID=2730917 RepID=UPI00227D9D79|nr:hypothetical protein [Alteromonas sp. a30]MCY7297152.1 hypothetical protein [Alteromonas sp. a30]